MPDSCVDAGNLHPRGWCQVQVDMGVVRHHGSPEPGRGVPRHDRTRWRDHQRRTSQDRRSEHGARRNVDTGEEPHISVTTQLPVGDSGCERGRSSERFAIIRHGFRLAEPDTRPPSSSTDNDTSPRCGSSRSAGVRGLGTSSRCDFSEGRPDPQLDCPASGYPGHSSPVRAWLSRTRMDVTPYRQSRDFRLLFLAGTVFYLGGMVTYVAIPFQLYDITGSNFVVGAVGIVELVPLIVFGLYGGALADHMDRRNLLVWTGVAQVVFTSVLVVNAFLPEPQVWLIFVVAGFLSAAQSLQRPSREALIPRTVAHDQLLAAVALSTAGIQIGMLAGPAVGGILLHSVGTGWCFLVDVVGIADRDGALPPDAPVPTRGGGRPAQPARDRRRAPVCGRSPGPARHLPHRHRRDVHGDAHRALPRVRAGRAAATGAARTALLRRDGRCA